MNSMCKDCVRRCKCNDDLYSGCIYREELFIVVSNYDFTCIVRATTKERAVQIANKVYFKNYGGMLAGAEAHKISEYFADEFINVFEIRFENWFDEI